MSRRPALLLGAAAAALLVAPACGKKGAPIPPLPRIPQTPQATVWRQRGDALEFRARYELRRLQGQPLRPPARPALMVVPAVTESELSGWSGAGREREFIARATMVDLPLFATGELGTMTLRADSVAVADIVGDGQPGAALALSLLDRRARSLPSPRVTLAPVLPPLAPLETFTARPEESRVVLNWSGVDERAGTVRIYRRVDGQGDAWRPWRSVPAGAGEAVDEGVRYGQELVYAAVVAQEGGVPVESAPVEATPIDYRDVFPPAPPRDVDAFALTGTVRLLWTPGGSPDADRVVVERQSEGEESFAEIGVVTGRDAFYVDEDVEPAGRYRYRLVAVDASGNRSAPTAATDWVSPRPPLDEGSS